MRLALATLLAFTATGAMAQTVPPVTSPPPATLTGAKPLDAKWEAVTREIYKFAIETPTVKGRGELPKLQNYLAAKLTAAGWAEADIHVLPYESVQAMTPLR